MRPSGVISPKGLGSWCRQTSTYRVAGKKQSENEPHSRAHWKLPKKLEETSLRQRIVCKSTSLSEFCVGRAVESFCPWNHRSRNHRLICHDSEGVTWSISHGEDLGSTSCNLRRSSYFTELKLLGILEFPIERLSEWWSCWDVSNTLSFKVFGTKA